MIRVNTYARYSKGGDSYHGVQVWIDGICFETECMDLLSAVELARKTAVALGLKWVRS